MAAPLDPVEWEKLIAEKEYHARDVVKASASRPPRVLQVSSKQLLQHSAVSRTLCNIVLGPSRTLHDLVAAIPRQILQFQADSKSRRLARMDRQVSPTDKRSLHAVRTEWTQLQRYVAISSRESRVPTLTVPYTSLILQGQLSSSLTQKVVQRRATSIACHMGTGTPYPQVEAYTDLLELVR